MATTTIGLEPKVPLVRRFEMTFPRDALPVGFFQGLSKINEESSGSLREILNRLRILAGGPTWHVNPDDPEAYPSINVAYDAADAALLSGEMVLITLVQGKTYNLVGGAFDPGAGRNIKIVPVGAPDGGINRKPSIIVNGDITLPDASAQSVRRQFLMEGTQFVGDYAGNSKWDVFFSHMTIEGLVQRTHGTDGCLMRWYDVEKISGAFTDTDGNASGTDGYWHLVNSRYLVNDPADIITLIDAVGGMFVNSQFVFNQGGAGAFAFDLSGGAHGLNFWGQNAIFMHAPTAGFLIYKNGGSSVINHAGDVRYIVTSTWPASVDFGVVSGWTSTPTGHATLFTAPQNSRPEPQNAFEGLRWADGRTKEVLIYNGTYWTVGDIMRKEIRVDIGSALADHDLGWDPPAAAAVVKTSMKILKTLTGAGGAVKAGMGTKAAGDPDKYALPGALTANQKDQNINPTWNDGGGDDLGITGCDAAGAALGTLAGSDDEDVQAMVWFRNPVTLP